jgi:hypothetical protein
MIERTTGKGRGKARWLTADSLKSGEREQYAVLRSYGTVTVELHHDRFAAERVEHGEIPMPWVVSIRVLGKYGATTEERTYHAFRLSAARKKFSELVRQHP